MKLQVIHKLTLLLVLALPASMALADAAARGATVYGNYCVNCHGDIADGLQDFQGDLDAFRVALAGSDDMPDPSGMLTEEEIRELFAYLLAERAGSGP